MQHSFKGACVFTQPDTFLLFGVVLLSLRTFHIEFDTSRTIYTTDSTFRLPMTLIVQGKKEQHEQTHIPSKLRERITISSVYKIVHVNGFECLYAACACLCVSFAHLNELVFQNDFTATRTT